MSGMPWVKLWVDILTDFKVLKLSDTQKWRFVELILVAAQCDAGGALVTGDSPVTHGDLAKLLRCNPRKLEKDIQKMIDVDLVIFDDGIIEVANFSDRQGPTQEEKRKKWRDRQRERRERVKKESPVSPLGVSPLEEEKKEEKEVKIKEEGIDPVGVVSTLFQNEIGGVTPMIREQVIDWVENYPLEWIEDSIRIASGNNKRRVDYIY